MLHAAVVYCTLPCKARACKDTTLTVYKAKPRDRLAASYNETTATV